MENYTTPPCPPQQQPQQIVINNVVEKKIGLGTAGFVLALLALIFCWVPVVDWILWLLGAIFSFIGVFKAPRGLAITGLVISFIGVIIMVIFFGALFAAASV